MATQFKFKLGDAQLRINKLQGLIHAGLGTPEIREEYRKLLLALNSIEFVVEFDCDGDGIPDDIEIFSNTSCCRPIFLDTVPDRSAMQKTNRSQMRKSR